MYVSDASCEVMDPVWGKKVVGGCLRAQWYRMTGTPKDVGRDTPDGLRKAAYGEAIENIEKRFLERAGIPVIAEELRMYWAEEHISGRVDAVIEWPKPGELTGLEHKCTAGYHNSAVFKGDPKIEHILQTYIYAYYYSHYIPVWKLQYFDRGTGQQAEYTLLSTAEGFPSVDGQMWNHLSIGNVLQRYRTLWKHYIDRTIPERDYELEYSKDKIRTMFELGKLNKTDTADFKKGKPIKKGDWKCAYCSYNRTCWKGY